MIRIDVSRLSAVSRSLQTAISLSILEQKPCHFFNIYSKRSKPGLREQELAIIRALARLGQGSLEQAQVGSQEMKFWPGADCRKQLSIKLSPANSIPLILQSALLASANSRQKIGLSLHNGATDPFSPPTIDYFRYVFLNIIGQIGFKVDIDIEKRGFYPQGGAELKAEIQPLGKARALSLIKPGPLNKLIIISGAGQNLRKSKVVEKQLSGAKQSLSKLKLPIEEKAEYYLNAETGSQITVIGQLENTAIGTSNSGKLGKSAETIGREAALDFLKQANSGACLDKCAASQIPAFIALSDSPSELSAAEISPECRDNIWLSEQFSGKAAGFEISGNKIRWRP
jgi:RNA 3'-phosphate cyclase